MALPAKFSSYIHESGIADFSWRARARRIMNFFAAAGSWACPTSLIAACKLFASVTGKEPSTIACPFLARNIRSACV